MWRLSGVHRSNLTQPSNLMKTTTVVEKGLLTSALIATIALILHSPPAFGASRSGQNYSNVTIPDDDGWVSSTITISSAPAGAVVTGIDVYFRCVHTYSADLVIDLNADVSGALGDYHLWSNEGGSQENPSRTVTGVSTFNGLSVNRTWYLYARDTAEGDTGEIDEWSITVYYTDPSQISL